MKTNSIKINAVLNVIYTITNMIFPLITYPYVTRVLSAAGMGKVSFFSSVSNYAIMLGSLGIGTYGIRAVAKVRTDKKELSVVASELLIINTIVTFTVTLLILLSSLLVDKFTTEPFLFGANMLMVFTAPISLNWLYSGMEQYAYITKRNIFFKAISLIMVFFLVKNQEDYNIYATILIFSNIASYICNLFYSKKFFEFHISHTFNYKRHLKPMLLLFASIMAVSVYTNLDTIMLGFINGDYEVGLYNVASKSKWILLSAVNAVSAVLLPRLSNYLSQNNIERYNLTLKKSTSFIFLLTIPVSFFFIVEAMDVVGILGGLEYEGAVLGMRFLMPILVISGFSNVIGNQVLIPHGRDSQFLRAVAIGATADVILNFILMPSWGCTGAAIATLFAELIQMCIQLYFSKSDILKNIQAKTIIKSVLSTFFSSALVVIIRRIIVFNVLINFVIVGGIFFISYVLLLIVLRENYTREMMRIIFSRFRK